jgi:hypothetical protein
MAYVKKVKWMIGGPLAVDALIERMRVLQDLVRPWVEREQRSMFSLDQFSRSLSEDIRLGGPQQQPPPQIIPGLELFLRARVESLQQQVESEHIE